MKEKLNMPNPQAHDLGEMFGIPQERMDAISNGMDEMVKLASTGQPRLVHASDVLRYIEDL